MIDYLIVIFNNYDLLDLQVYNFKKRFNEEDYNLVVIDNTLDHLKKDVFLDDVIGTFIKVDSSPTFDGVSHGKAIDIGLQYCESEIVCIQDSDFFFLNSDIHSYVKEKFDLGYKAVGTEYNDGKDTAHWVNMSPNNFKDIPCCFGSYYEMELAKSQSWIINEEEVNQNRSTGFVEVGWRIRKHILDNNIKTMNWKTDSNNYGHCYFKDEEQIMGFHYVAGSHRRWNDNSKQELLTIIESN
jgi:hypothetical protein